MIGGYTSSYFLSLLLGLPGILTAISFHEAAHGYAADALGDNTPRLSGRLTVNPLAHIDIIGFLAMVFLRFGWAKPVPINPNNFKNRKKGMVIVALAGCLTNLLLGFISMAAVVACSRLAENQILLQILYLMSEYNVLFAIFNLIPLPPLDGSHVLAECLPYNAQIQYEKIARYSYFILLILMITGVFSFIISPPVNGLMNLFYRFWAMIIG